MTFKIGLLAFEGCMASSIAGPLDVIQVANTLIKRRKNKNGMVLKARMFSVNGGSVQASNGMVFATEQFDPGWPNALILGGIDHEAASDLLDQVRRNKPTCRAISVFSETGQTIALPCTATFLAAEAKLLDNCAATTSWWLTALFRRRYPLVHLKEDALVVTDASYMTSGGVTSYFDLTLRLIANEVDRDLSRGVASVMALDPVRLRQAPLLTRALLEDTRSEFGRQAEGWLLAHQNQAYDSKSLARHCAMSERTLLRKFQSEFGTSPRQHHVRLRIEQAKMLLEASTFSIDEIAVRCGYSDTSTFSKRFSVVVGSGPATYRNRFGLRSRP